MIKAVIYIIILFLSIYAIEGFNIGKLIRKNSITQIKVMIILVSMTISYCVTNFICDFINNVVYF